MGDPRHIVAVCGLFLDEQGQVLLVKTPRQEWECPGGQVEQGESLIDALIREADEESGCAVAVDQLVAVYTNPEPPDKVIFMFRGRVLSGVPRPYQELSCVRV